MNIQEWVKKSFDRQADYGLVTGASSGIGLEYLRALARLGCRCIATSNNATELADACKSLRDETGTSLLEVTADLSDHSGIQFLLNSIRDHPIAILINCAGFGLKGSFVDHEPNRYADLVVLNSLAPTLISRYVIPQMIARNRGLVVHVASINAVTPIAYNAVYTATKAYILYYAFAIAYELASSPLVFQIVLPGTTNTPFHERQGAVPQSMFMNPDLVVKRSLDRLDRSISVSNKLDRVLFPIILMLPLRLRTWLGTSLLKRRLKFKEKPSLVRQPPAEALQ